MSSWRARRRTRRGWRRSRRLATGEAEATDGRGVRDAREGQELATRRLVGVAARRERARRPGLAHVLDPEARRPAGLAGEHFVCLRSWCWSATNRSGRRVVRLTSRSLGRPACPADGRRFATAVDKRRCPAGTAAAG